MTRHTLWMGATLDSALGPDSVDDLTLIHVF